MYVLFPFTFTNRTLKEWGLAALCLGEGLFEVSEQHGRHDALFRVDGKQGR